MQDYASTLDNRLKVPARMQQTLEPAPAPAAATADAVVNVTAQPGSGAKRGKKAKPPKKGAGGGSKGRNPLKEQIAAQLSESRVDKLRTRVEAIVKQAQRLGRSDAAAVVTELARREGEVVFSGARDVEAEAMYYSALLAAQVAVCGAAIAESSRVQARSGTGTKTCVSELASCSPGAVPEDVRTAVLDVFSTVRYMRTRFLAPAGDSQRKLTKWLAGMPAELCTALRAGAPPLAPVADTLEAELSVGSAPSVRAAGAAVAAAARAQLAWAGERLARTTDAVEDARVPFVPDRWQVRFRGSYLSAHLGLTCIDLARRPCRPAEQARHVYCDSMRVKAVAACRWACWMRWTGGIHCWWWRQRLQARLLCPTTP